MLHIPDHYVPNKSHVTQLVACLRTGEWMTLKTILETPHWNAHETRMALDILHYAGIIRSREDDRGLAYQWIKATAHWDGYVPAGI